VLSVYDVEKLIMEYKKCGSRTLMEDVELLFQMYDKSGTNRINFFDFKDQLSPLIN
jgi:Ca2+-binding EF-hand superfamily protein